MNFAEKITESPIEEIQTLEAIEKDEKHPYIYVVKHHESADCTLKNRREVGRV